MLPFSAALNDLERAEALGHPEWATLADANVDGLITVGAVDLDGNMAPFSNPGHVELAAPGVDIPVGGPDGNADTSGTSFASPIALQTAFLMHAANPDLTADDIARLIQDPRALVDVPGTDRDGGGRLDPFEAIRLAEEEKGGGGRQT